MIKLVNIMDTTVNLSKVFSTFLFLFYFFPNAYVNGFTNYLKYFFLFIAIIYLFKHSFKCSVNLCSPIIITAISYYSYVYGISYYEGLEYASYGNFISIFLLLIIMLYSMDLIKYKTYDFINMLYYLFFAYIFIDIFTILLFPNGLPGIYSDYGEQFLFGNKNNHTIQILMFLLLSVWKYQCENRKSIIQLVMALIMTLFLIIMLNSSTTFVSVLFAVFGIILYIHRITWLFVSAKKLLAANLVLNFLIVNGYTAFLTPIVVDMLGKDLTFTTRSEIWEKVIPLIFLKPFFGWGNFNNDESTFFLGHINTHNQLLECLFVGGIVLFAIFCYSLTLLSVKIDQMDSVNKKIIGVTFLVAFFIKITFEQVASAHISWFFLLLLYEYCNIECLYDQ